MTIIDKLGVTYLSDKYLLWNKKSSVCLELDNDNIFIYKGGVLSCYRNACIVTSNSILCHGKSYTSLSYKSIKLSIKNDIIILKIGLLKFEFDNKNVTVDDNGKIYHMIKNDCNKNSFLSPSTKISAVLDTNFYHLKLACLFFFFMVMKKVFIK